MVAWRSMHGTLDAQQAGRLLEQALSKLLSRSS
jgi:hypothetical protein